MAANGDYRWIRPDGSEVSFPDRGSLMARIHSREIAPDDLVRISSDGPWMKAGDLVASMEARLDELAAQMEPDHGYSMGEVPWHPTSKPGPSGDEAGWTTAHAPWRRYFARLADFTLAGLVFAILLMFLAPEVFADPENEVLLTWGSVLLAFPVLDAFLLSRWNTSPGKWMLSVRTVRPRSEPIPYGDALRRAYGVLIRGMWLGIPFLAIIPLVRAHGRARKGEYQPWEASTRTYTQVRALDGKVLFYIALMMLVFLLLLAEAAS
jgi:uncharacterized RDD family membrane protein YckC